MGSGGSNKTVTGVTLVLSTFQLVVEATWQMLQQSSPATQAGERAQDVVSLLKDLGLISRTM